MVPAVVFHGPGDIADLTTGDGAIRIDRRQPPDMIGSRLFTEAHPEAFENPYGEAESHQAPPPCRQSHREPRLGRHSSSPTRKPDRGFPPRRVGFEGLRGCRRLDRIR